MSVSPLCAQCALSSLQALRFIDPVPPFIKTIVEVLTAAGMETQKVSITGKRRRQLRRMSISIHGTIHLNGQCAADGDFGSIRVVKMTIVATPDGSWQYTVVK